MKFLWHFYWRNLAVWLIHVLKQISGFVHRIYKQATSCLHNNSRFRWKQLSKRIFKKGFIFEFSAETLFNKNERVAAQISDLTILSCWWVKQIYGRICILCSTFQKPKLKSVLLNWIDDNKWNIWLIKSLKMQALLSASFYIIIWAGPTISSIVCSNATLETFMTIDPNFFLIWHI